VFDSIALARAGILDLLLSKQMYICGVGPEYLDIPSLGATDIPSRLCRLEFARDLHKQKDGFAVDFPMISKHRLLNIK